MNRYVIHIDGSDRYQRMVQEMDSQYSGEYKIFPAIIDSKGSKGISMSFKKIIIENYQDEMVHIFEDDIKFTAPNSRCIFESAMEKLPEDWDIFLGGSYSNPEWYIKQTNDHFVKLSDFASLHNVVIKKSAYDKLLSHDVNGNWSNIDRHLGNCGLNVYLCNPQIAIQYPGYSYNIGKQADYTNRLGAMNILK